MLRYGNKGCSTSTKRVRVAFISSSAKRENSASDKGKEYN